MGVTDEAQSAKESPQSAEASGRYGAYAVVAVMVGLAIRLWVAVCSVGTNDTITWRRFGVVIQEIGLIDAYRYDPMLNHPPGFLLWAWLCARLTDAHPSIGSVAGDQAFGALFKLPAIVADIVACWLLWRIGRRGGGPRLGAMLCSLLALSPLNILISAYHCNTDGVYACLALAAFESVASGRLMLLAGLLLGAAINVKLIPVLLIPALFAMCRGLADFRRVFIGLAMMSIPFLLLIYVMPTVIRDKLLLYGSNVDSWGATYLLMLFTGVPANSEGGPGIATWYFKTGGRWIMLGGIVLAAALCARRRIGPIASAAVASAVFMLLAPGFAVQYLVLPGVLILAADARAGARFAWFGGLFVGATYYSFLHGTPGWFSQFHGFIPDSAAVAGLVCYAILLHFALGTILGRESSVSTSSVLEPSP